MYYLFYIFSELQVHKAGWILYHFHQCSPPRICDYFEDILVNLDSQALY